jgi:hypothetical protein
MQATLLSAFLYVWLNGAEHMVDAMTYEKQEYC